MIKYIFFDCMETVIDLKKVPTPKDYALFAFKDSSYSNLWSDFNSFYKEYNNAKDELIKTYSVPVKLGFNAGLYYKKN